MLSLRKKELVLLAVITFILVITCVFSVDQILAQWLELNRIKRFYHPLRFLTDAGESNLYFILAFIGIAGPWIALKFGWLAHLADTMRKILNWSLFLLLSLVISGVFLHLFKFLLGRQRPHMTDDYQSQVFSPLTTNWSFHSMPSGHSQTLFTVATVLALIWPRGRWFFWSLAFLLALTRVTLEQHFLSDVLAGSFLGFIVTFFLGVWRKKAQIK